LHLCHVEGPTRLGFGIPAQRACVRRGIGGRLVVLEAEGNCAPLKSEAR
jgi:hypothetical protein